MMKGIIKYLKVFIILPVLGAGILFIHYYNRIYAPNVDLEGGEDVYLYIPAGSDYQAVMDLIAGEGFIRNTASFDWLARKKNYPNHVNPGRYRLRDKMNNNRLINMLRSGRQEPVRLVFNNIRVLERLAGVVSRQIEADSASISDLLKDEEFLASLGLSRESVTGIFLPNTYEVYWNTSAEQFIRRMLREYERFWDRERRARAESIGLSPPEVMTLASIVDEETMIDDEKPVIAGVYMNRLNRGIRLQADPTVKFANGDMNMQRVLKVHLEKDSPYNTYRYAGLPPGPIRVPSVSAVEAVLNYQRHDYLYFCARDDFSGYHVFARTLDQHNKNARSYQNALNRRKIYN
jgi:UPF0755 protein